MFYQLDKSSLFRSTELKLQLSWVKTTHEEMLAMLCTKNNFA